MHSTLRPTVSSAIFDSMISATFGAWTTINTNTIDYWFGALSRRATPFDLARDLATWTIAMADRQRPPWAHDNSVVKEWPAARLRDYSAPDADPAMVATVILPPQAGHDSSIVDFAEGQSQVIVGRDNGCPRIFSLDWIGATQETKDLTIDDYMSMLRDTAEFLGGKINLIGDCQGGWLATIFTALYPEKVNSLAIAGAPIDFHAGEPLIHDWLNVTAPQGDLSFFRRAVEANNGVLPGRFLLDGFKAMQPDQELARSLQLLTNIHDSQHVDRHRKFENWFQWTQAIPGEFYLWVVEHLFLKNSLIQGELEVEGCKVNLADISCPLFLMAGQADHITPAEQVWALADYVSTPPERIGRQSSVSGHLGLFMSHEALLNHWTVIFREMGALSTPTSKDNPNVLTDEPTHSHPTMWGDTPAVESTMSEASAAMAKAEVKAEAPAPKARTPRKTTGTTSRSTSAASKSSTTATRTRSKVAAPKTAAPKVAETEVVAPAAAAPKTAAPKAAAPKTAAPKAAAPAKQETAQLSTVDDAAGMSPRRVAIATG